MYMVTRKKMLDSIRDLQLARPFNSPLHVVVDGDPCHSMEHLVGLTRAAVNRICVVDHNDKGYVWEREGAKWMYTEFN